MDEQLEHTPRPKKINSKNGFSQYSFFPELFLNIIINKLKNPTQVQKKALPLIMENKDVVVCYKTGSGKTLSYILPIINRLQSHSQIVGARTLILIPTRDLADQITKVLKSFLHKIDIRYSLILGGHTFQGQFETLSQNPDIIIATPGRLVQLLTETDLRLSRVQTIVFDEADQLFGDSKFINELREIIGKCPANSQKLMFSATITDDLNEFAQAGLSNYSYIHQEIALPETMTLDFFIIRPDQKAPMLFKLLNDITAKDKVIVFVSTRFHVDYLLALLQKQFECYGIYGKMDMEMRENSLYRFRKCKRGVLIVTDVAARGLDIPEVNYILHFDYPANHQIFVHRSGRTARAGRKGHTITLITHQQIGHLLQLGHFINKKLSNSAECQDSINYGTVPSSVLIPYVNIVKQRDSSNKELEDFKKMMGKGYERFNKCRKEIGNNFIKKSKSLRIDTHFEFAGTIGQEQSQFLDRIKNFTPKRSFIQLQRIMNDKVIESDPFLGAVDKIRKQQNLKIQEAEKKQRIRQKSSIKWKELLDRNQINEYEQYKAQKNSYRTPINVEGVDIQIAQKKKKSTQQDFKNSQQYISTEKDPRIRTQFDDLPRIKNNQIDHVLQDENPVKKNQPKRVWDKTKKNFVWQKDQEDRYSKEQKGKKAYDLWKKKSKMSIPKIGQTQDEEKVGRAKDSWTDRRKARHGWKDTKPKASGPVRNLKNNKTKAIQKKFKKRIISKSQKSGKSGSKPKKGRSKK